MSQRYGYGTARSRTPATVSMRYGYGSAGSRTPRVRELTSVTSLLESIHPAASTAGIRSLTTHDVRESAAPMWDRTLTHPGHREPKVRMRDRWLTDRDHREHAARQLTDDGQRAPATHLDAGVVGDPRPEGLAAPRASQRRCRRQTMDRTPATIEPEATGRPEGLLPAANHTSVSAPCSGVRSSGPTTLRNTGNDSATPGVSAQPGCIA